MAESKARTRGRPPAKEALYPQTFIAAWRRHLGVTQEDLAEKIGLGRSSISRFEGAMTGRALLYIERLARELEIPPEQLLYRDPQDGDPNSPWVIKERAASLTAEQRKLVMGMIDLMMAEDGRE